MILSENVIQSQISERFTTLCNLSICWFALINKPGRTFKPQLYNNV